MKTNIVTQVSRKDLSNVQNENQQTFGILPVQEMCSKDEVMNYSFPPLVERLQVELKLSKKDAEVLFKDMLMFLYICGVNVSKDRYSPPKMIDEAWHNFILFTKEYTTFCHDHFGRFLHHNPFTKTDRITKSRLVVPVIPIARMEFGMLSSNWRPSRIRAICDCEGNCGCP